MQRSLRKPISSSQWFSMAPAVQKDIKNNN